MAMMTILQACSDQEIAVLREVPSKISDLDKQADDFVFTHFAESISYFLCGDAYPASEHVGALAGIFGFDSVACANLENGAFLVVTPAQARELATALAAADLTAVRERATDVDIEELVADKELYDLEPLIGDDDLDLPKLIASELTSIVVFYRHAAERGLGAVIYTS